MRKPISQRFEEMSRLYHFTSFKAACSIIESGKLRFGKPFRMNDLIESNRIVFQRVLLNDMSEDERNGLFAEEEMRRYQQVSFSQDKEYDDRLFLGFDLHSMWGLYANKGYGVCLVFDKNKLKLEEGDYGKNVEYYNLVPADFEFKNRSKAGIKGEIWRRRDEIFFNKRKEWEYEQEYRIIRRARNEFDTEYLDVSDSLSFAIISKDVSVFENETIFDGDCYWTLRSLKRKLPVLSYDYGLDWYTLSSGFMDPIWAERVGFF